MPLSSEPNATSDLIPLGDVKLKMSTVYQNMSSLLLKTAIHFSACAYGGPIALAESHNDSSWRVTIRTSAGRSLSNKIKIGDIFGMEWTRGQRLIVLDRRGCASQFSATGEPQGSFYFSKDIREVRDLRLFTNGARDSGMAVLDDQMRVFVVNTIQEPIVWTIHTPTRNPPSAWTAIHSSSLTSVIFVDGREFYAGQQGEPVTKMQTPWAEGDGQYVRIVSDWNNRRFAVYHSSRIIQIISSDLSTCISTIRVPGEYSIYKLGWVGNEAVYLQRTPTFIQFFPADSTDSIVHDHNCDFVQVGVEPDGVKLFSNTSLQFVSPVTDFETHVLGVASSSDGAFLHEACQLAARKASTRAYEYSHMIKDMNRAISQCLEAACSVAQPDLQKSLLKAAHFGVPFTTSFDSSRMVQVIRDLRVLNEVRRERTGMPITYAQLKELSMKSLINRLVDAHSFGVAVRVCALDQEPEGVDMVLLSWVRSLLEPASVDPQHTDIPLLAEIIAAKFAEFPQVSFADAAKKAIDARLPQLARLLIKKETDEERVVGILLALHDVTDALGRAADSQRPELMHLVIRHLIKNKQKREYELDIQKIPGARVLYAEYVTQEKGGSRGASAAKMLALLEQGSDYELKLLFHLEAACDTQDYDDRKASLEKAKMASSEIQDQGISGLVGDALNCHAAGWQARTARDEVIAVASNPAAVQQIKQLAKLTDKQVFLWTVEGLAKAGKWEQLFDLANKNKKYGFAPFIRACVANNRRQDCDRYMGKITLATDQIAAHLALGNYLKAARIAFDRKDMATLQNIYIKSHKDAEQKKRIGLLVNAC